MNIIRPFRALRPAAGRAADIVAPPYDVVNREEARRRVVGRPWSFLRVSRPEVDLGPTVDPHTAEVYAQGARQFRAMQEARVLRRDPHPGLYVYRLTAHGHTQTGLAALASVAAYRDNRIRRHEHTLPAKEQDRTRHIEALNAQTGPALLAYRARADIDAEMARVTAGPPVAVIATDDAVTHTLWLVSEGEAQAALLNAFSSVDVLYIADGHHRSAAAAAVAAARGGEEGASHNGFLAVMFPDRELRILPYHRLVKDTGESSKAVLLEKIAERFLVEPSPGAVTPATPREFGMYLHGTWFYLRLKDSVPLPSADRVARLPTSLLTRFLLAPGFGITDLRNDPRIDFAGGIDGVRMLERRVDGGEMGAAFTVCPTRIEDLMAIADTGEFMPPKSTWFEPKLADGLLCHVLD